MLGRKARSRVVVVLCVATFPGGGVFLWCRGVWWCAAACCRGPPGVVAGDSCMVHGLGRRAPGRFVDGVCWCLECMVLDSPWPSVTRRPVPSEVSFCAVFVSFVITLITSRIK